MKQIKIFAWYDKVDKSVLLGSLMCSASTRSVCRGFLASFDKDKRMNIKEYDLVCLGIIDEDTGRIDAYARPEVIDPNIVYGEVDTSSGDVVDE